MCHLPATSLVPATTVVVGLGNPLRRDDGVGPEVVEQLARCAKLPPGVDLLADDRGGLALMERLVGYERAIIVDAMIGDEGAGAVRVMPLGDLLTAHSACTHDTSLMTALELGRLTGAALPGDAAITIVGVEVVECLAFGEGCTPEVAAAVPRAVERVLELLRDPWPSAAANDLQGGAEPPEPWSRSWCRPKS